jgi:hypothetical protein
MPDLSRRDPRSSWHAESLLRIPLVRHMLEDPDVDLVARGIDARWYYERLVPVKLGGFNAASGSVYYPVKSFMARWLREPESSTRKHNENDVLVLEVLFAVHDYLHVWAYRAINELNPSLGFGIGEVTRANLEDFVFCHLVSEAVATVGLDYWYLCTSSLNEVCDIGSNLDRGLTVGYHERFSREYERYAPGLRVQRKEFLASLANFYCTGIFHGVEERALRESPLILKWLDHELRYGQSQRRYARQWLAFLSKEPLSHDAGALAAPVAAGRKWQRRTLRALGELLWDKVKNDRLDELAFRFGGRGWSSPRRRPADFRFVNLNWFPSIDAALRAPSSPDPESETYRLYQLVSRFDFGHCDSALVDAVPVLLRSGDLDLTERLLGAQRRVPRCKGEPRDLLLVG